MIRHFSRISEKIEMDFPLHDGLHDYQSHEMDNKLTINTNEEVCQYTDCEDCGRYCYTGGRQYPDGFRCIDCVSDEDNSDSEDEE
jgi:hypothetical protein